MLFMVDETKQTIKPKQDKTNKLKINCVAKTTAHNILLVVQQHCKKNSQLISESLYSPNFSWPLTILSTVHRFAS